MIDVRPLTSVIGAEVSGVDLATAADDAETMTVLHRALLDHLVLFFRDQEVTPEQQLAVGRWFGELEIHAFATPHPDHPELVVLDQTTPATDGANSWHSDSSFMAQPAMGSILAAQQLPPLGGDTCWASMYAAYEALSPSLRDMLDELSALHDLTGPLVKAVQGGHSIGGIDEMQRRWPPLAHPVVRTHPETGRKLLFVNSNFVTRIVGLTERENAALLPMLLDHVRSPDFQVRFRWEPGSVAFWDNRSCQHYAVPDYDQRRIMHRVTIAGDEPR